MTENGYPGEERNFLLEEMEIRPNLRAAKAMRYAMLAIILNWMLNEAGVFRVETELMRIGSSVALIIMLIPQLFVAKRERCAYGATKYVMSLCCVGATAVITVLMSFHTTLCLILPLLMATQYKTRKVGLVALGGSILCTLFSPVAGFLLGTWDTLFLQTLLEIAGFTSGASAEPLTSAGSAIRQIMMYLSMPELVMVLVTGYATLQVIRTGKENVNSHLAGMQSRQRLLDMQTDALKGLAGLIESRDLSTGMHVTNTQNYVTLMVNYLLEHRMYPETVTPEYADALARASVLHDIGKISIPDAILNKPGKFTPSEFEIMKRHAELGGEIAEHLFRETMDPALFRVVWDVTATHHERWDGQGYPKGLKAEEIPLAGRIMAIADVYDALVSKRVYKDAYTVSEAYRIVEEEAGTHFERKLVEVFVALRPQVEAITLNGAKPRTEKTDS